jgi:hypothetical protein
MFLTTMPLWLAAVILIVPTTAIAMAGPVVARRCFELDRLRMNNEVAGFKFATIGVLYAVLLAFAVIVVWERFDQADGEVAQEASAAATVYLLTGGIDDAHGAAIRDTMTGYLTAAIAEDWPAMEQESDSPAVTEALHDIYTEVLKFHTFDADEGVVVAAILQQVDQISGARRERLVMADGIVPGIIWLVLFGGAVITIGFTFFFGTENLRAQMLMTGALSVLIFTGLFTIVIIDHPFAGAVKVSPEALVTVLEDFSQ